MGVEAGRKQDRGSAMGRDWAQIFSCVQLLAPAFRRGEPCQPDLAKFL